MKHLPPLNYLRSFEAAARHLSFTEASNELNCTQAAVSQHIRALESFIGRPLFHRFPRSLQLTEVGSSYLPAIRDALSQVEIATEAVVAMPRTQRVIISCPVTFASLWLAPKITQFMKEHKDIDVTLHGTVWGDVGPEVSDLRVRLGDGSWGGMKPQKITHEKLVLVCSPNLVKGKKALAAPEDIPEFPLIHILGKQEYWTKIADHFGLENLDLEGGIKTDASNIAMEFAAEGQGIAVTLTSMAKRYLDRGWLVCPFKTDIDSDNHYFLLEDEKLRPNLATKLLRDWLLEQGGQQNQSS